MHLLREYANFVAETGRFEGSFPLSAGGYGKIM
jgi:hypothetical protein